MGFYEDRTKAVSDHERQAKAGPKPDPADRRVDGLAGMLGLAVVIEAVLLVSAKTAGSRQVMTSDDFVALALILTFGIAALLASLRAARSAVIGVLAVVDGLLFASLILVLEDATPWFPIGAIVMLGAVTGTLNMLRTYPEERWKVRGPGRLERRT